MTDDLPFIDPTAGGSKTTVARASRPMDLGGMVVGLLDNSKEQADIILDVVAETLLERYGVSKVVMRRKQFYSKPAAAELMDEMANEVDVAVAALGG